MAVMSRTPSTPQRTNTIRYPDVDVTGMMGSRGEIVEVPATPTRVIEDTMYVAVGKDEKDSESTLKWALHNSGGRKICIIHVHQPADKIPIMGTKFRVSELEEHKVRGYHETEREKMLQLLEKYCGICQRVGVRAAHEHIVMDSIEKGIIKLIIQHGITKLVMGAAADKLYSKKMMEPKSKKSVYVRQQAPDSCHIWFVCKGNLIYTREGILDGLNMGMVSLSLHPNTNTGTGQTNSLRSRSVTEGLHVQQRVITPAHDYRRVMSDNNGMRTSILTSPDGSGDSTPRNRLTAGGGVSDDWNGISRSRPSTGSRFSTCSSSDMVEEDSALISYAVTGRNEIELGSNAIPHLKEDLRHSSPPSVLQERNLNDELYDQLIQAMAEADNSRRDALEESIRRRKAEVDTMEALRRAKASECSYTEELRRRIEVEEELARGIEELEKIKQQLDEVIEELRVALENKSFLESQISQSDLIVHELEQKMFSAVELLQKYKKERDELEVERDDALRMAEELRKQQAEESSSTSLPQLFLEFSFAEIEESTHNFDPSLKIGEGGYGSIYRAILHHTQVAIKMLHSHSLQGPSEFQQEVNVLSKLRHPNLVALIGACPEAWILVYEYLTGGSLEDRLSCKNNTSPLPWQTRIRIAAELCSVLIFLHSCSVVHGDLKPANVLLDSNFVTKLSDFGICRVLSQNEFSSNNTTLCCRTDPKGTFAYMDPEFLDTGELTPKSDVFSFGIILLRLLTGMPAMKIAKEVQSALDKGNLMSILDPTAGDWPFVQAKQLAHLALSCCEKERRNRPDLASEVWRILEPMKVSCGVSSFRLGSEEQCQVPHYFICPIFQEVMQDPVVAADGYTYEAEALKGWLELGHDTSPMTNLKLGNNTLLPNHALRSAIQEWLHQP